MSEQAFYGMDREVTEGVLKALAKPVRAADDWDEDAFDPWEDIIHGIHGSYSSESDAMMVEALEAIRDGATFEYIKKRGFAGEFVLYVISGHGLIEYGTSPRGGWPISPLRDVWQTIIDKWVSYADAQWGGQDWRTIDAPTS